MPKDVYKAAYYISRNQFDTEEVVQDAFIIAFKKIDMLKDKDKFKPWICTIAVNLAKRKFKNKKRELLMDETEKIIPYTSDMLEHISLEDHLVQNEIKEYIREQMYNLNPQHKEVIYLYYFEQLSYQEIADQLDISIGTVKSRISRAKLKLKEYIIEDIGKVGDYSVKGSI
ncbi:MAG: RNA polymerase sigma factor [Clostridiales bacterium]|nr:RNA polymerase sigma factor [Clostridiales bacterium]